MKTITIDLVLPDTAADAALLPGKEWWERLNVIADAISARGVFLARCEEAKPRTLVEVVK